MGTRANIVRKNADGSLDLIYTHWDGYPEHHAPILLAHYSNDEAVASLIALGDLSSLGEKIGHKHNFDARPHGMCTAYGRDRSEQNTASKHFPNRKALAAYLSDAWTEWVYVWDVTKQDWTYTNNPSPTWFNCCGARQRKPALLKDWKQHEEQAL